MNTSLNLSPLFAWVMHTTWQAAILAALILLVQLLFRRKLAAGWRYSLWLLLVARLLMPGLPPSSWSIFNLAKIQAPRFSVPPRAAPLLDNTARTTDKVRSADFQSAILQVSNLRTLNSLRPSGLVSQPLQLHSSSQGLTSDARKFRPNVEQPSVRGTSASSGPSFSLSWLSVAATIWFAGALFLGLRLFISTLRFRSRIRRYVPMQDAEIIQLIHQCAEVLGVRQPLTVIETEDVESPAVWGLWRRHLLLPPGLLGRLTPRELRHVFLHELAHLKRRDLEMSWLVAVLQLLHWFNPVLWLAFARMRADRELAVDALVVAHAGEGGSVYYGETILKVLEGFRHGTILPGLAGIAESKAQLKERLQAMGRRQPSRPWRWAAAGLALCLGGLALTDAVGSNKSVSTEYRAAVKTAQCRATAELKDGSRVVGQPSQEALPFQSDLLGDFQLAVNRIRSIQWPRDNQPDARLKAMNGDEFQVRLRTPEFRLTTQFGEIKLATTMLKQVQFSTVGGAADLHRGLVALWSADDNARDSAGSHDGELRFGAGYAPGKVGRAFHFHGSRQRVHIEDSKDFEINGSFTIAGWVYVEEFPHQGAGGVICLRGDNRAGLDTFTIATQPDQRIAFTIDSENNEDTTLFAPAKSGQWFHVAGVYDEQGRRLALYVDGRLAAEKNDPVKPMWQLDPSNEPGIGLGNTEGTFHNFPFSGRIDEWAIYSRALSESEVQALVDLGNAGESLASAK
ncbi:MAG: hypothetical protein C5B50_22920 [Verrucomicrobia bacterium]|nr:MAG: hypothetical protein C5B50_22920 [Verrucomicrobiota bacterium]